MNTLAIVFRRFHRDETGAPEMSTILIVALVAIPLVIGLILFGRRILGWLKGAASME